MTKALLKSVATVTRTTFEKVSFAFTVLAFLASLLVHCSTYPNPGINNPPWPIGLTMFLGIFIIAPVSIITARRMKPDVAYNIDQLPRWLMAITLMVVVNLAIVFATPSPGKGEGVTSEQDGKYLLVSHGRTLRELTYNQYCLRRNMDYREQSAIFMVGYVISAYPFWLAAWGKSLIES